MKLSRNLVWFGSIVLAATAAFHASGYPSVSGAIAGSNLSEGLGNVVKGLWLFVSYHWLFVALIAVAALHPALRISRALLAFCSAVLVADALLLLVYVGPFIGELLLGISAVAYAVAAATRKSEP